MSHPTRYRPAKGARVLKRHGLPVADAGEELPATPYFARLITDGDLVPVAASKSSNTTGSKPA